MWIEPESHHGLFGDPRDSDRRNHDVLLHSRTDRATSEASNGIRSQSRDCGEEACGPPIVSIAIRIHRKERARRYPGYSSMFKVGQPFLSLEKDTEGLGAVGAYKELPK
jgi:hypothetical protein